MNIFVTGGSGMTGAHLLLKLAESGHNLTALKRVSSDIEITRKVFNYHNKTGDKLFTKIKWVNGDLLDYEVIEENTKDIDYVYHTAAMVSFKPKEKKKMQHMNIQGTANIVNACLSNKIKKLCHVSSVAAIGEAPYGTDLKENLDNTDFKNVSDYAISKRDSEKEVWRGIAEGLNAVIVNPSVILGAGNWYHGSPRMIKASWDNLKYYTKGKNGFIDVRDVVGSMISLTESDISAERFILNAENITFRKVFDMIADNLEKKRPHKYANNFMLHSLKTFDKIRYYISGKEPRLTKHTLRSSQQWHTCSNEKLTEAIDYKFINIQDTIKDICRIFLEEHRPN